MTVVSQGLDALSVRNVATEAGVAPGTVQYQMGKRDDIIAKAVTFPDAVAAGKISFAGNPMRLAELMSLMDEFPRMFEIVAPKRTKVT